MTEYLHPGVYTERVDATCPGISAIRTDVAAFVGIARSGPLDTPVPLQSFRQFQAHFGDFSGQGFLAYAVRAFFENGGSRCWVVRVASREPGYNARPAALTLCGNHRPVWRIEAANPGTWGNRLTVAMRSQRLAQTVLDTVRSTAHYAVVASVAGFVRGTLVRLSQGDGAGGVTEQRRVVTHVDGETRRLYWVHPKPGAGLPYDAAVTGFDRNRPISVESLSYRMLVYRDGRLLAHFPDINPIPEHPRYGPLLLRPAQYPVRIGTHQRLPTPPPPVVIKELRSDLRSVPEQMDIAKGRRLALTGGRDGLNMLTVHDFIGKNISPLDSDAVQRQKRRGIEALHAVDEIALVAIPDIVIRPERDPVYETEPVMPPDPCLECPPRPEPRQQFQPGDTVQELPPRFSDDRIYQVQAALIQHCEARGDRFAVLDPPYGAAQQDRRGVSAVQAWRARFETTYAALYYPWLKVSEPRGTAPVRAVPPSGHVLGQYAAHDLTVGVHKAAANRPLAWVQDLTAQVSGGRHDILNPLGINAIRDALGRGLRIMGARTLTSDPHWRYINVRRLLIMIRKAIDVSTQWSAFEPNSVMTRNKIQLALTGFLTALWQRGALAGDTAEHAFFVTCDEQNNPPAQRSKGRLLAEVGVAPSIPFEFVVLRVGRQGNQLEIAEAGFLARAA